MRLSDRHLEVLEDALLDDVEIGEGRGRAVVVIADRRQAPLLAPVGEDRHEVGAEAQIAQPIRLHKSCPGEIRLPAERAVELGRMADRLVDGEEQIARIDDEIALSRRDGLGAGFWRASSAPRRASSMKTAGTGRNPSRDRAAG